MQLELKVCKGKVWRKRMRVSRGQTICTAFMAQVRHLACLHAVRSHRAMGSNVSFRKGTESVLM